MTSALLYAPNGFWELSKEALNEVCDGCGAEPISNIVPDNLLGLNITDACNIHDYMYATGETEKDRKVADRVFRNNMIRIINHDPGKWLKPLRRLLAIFYYRIVRELGGPWFWDKKNKTGLMKSPNAVFTHHK